MPVQDLRAKFAQQQAQLAQQGAAIAELQAEAVLQQAKTAEADATIVRLKDKAKKLAADTESVFYDYTSHNEARVAAAETMLSKAQAELAAQKAETLRLKEFAQSIASWSRQLPGKHQVRGAGGDAEYVVGH